MITLNVIGWFKCNYESDWLVELSDNNLASELVENRTFFEPITIKEIVIFMIKLVTPYGIFRKLIANLQKLLIVPSIAIVSLAC